MLNSFHRHWLIHRPYLLGFTLITLGLATFFGWAALSQQTAEWWLISFLLLILLLLFWFIQGWFYFQTERTTLPKIPNWFIQKGRISTQDHILFPYVADSRIAPPLIQHLTTGQLWLVDVFTPQEMTASTTKRKRGQDILPEKDPRLKMIPGSITLLPIQDGEIDIVILTDVLQSITQFGDRERFLTELNRVLKPNGRIIFFEPVKSFPKILVNPRVIVSLWDKSQLDQCLIANGFSRIESQTSAGLTIVGRAMTPGRYENSQLPLEF